MNEQKLIHKLKQGDRLALDRAMDTYTPYLAAVVWRALGPAASAEEIGRASCRERVSLCV